MIKFLTTTVELEDRHIEPKIEDLKPGNTVPSKHEEITLKVNLVGSGDTRNFGDAEILSKVMDQLRTIEKEETS